MHSHTSGLVDDEQVAVFEQDGGLELGLQATRHGRLFAHFERHGRNPHIVALVDARGRADAPLIDADFALAQHPVNPAFGHAGQFRGQKVVYALTICVGTDAHVAHAGMRVLFLGQ